MALTDKLTAIGNAIREKTGKSDLLALDQMPTEIQSITTAGEIQELNITSNGTYNAPDGVDGYNPVTVNVQPTLETLSVTKNGTYNAPDGVDGYNSITVEVQQETIPSELLNHSGDCSYKFSGNGWNWIFDKYGNQITTSNITNAKQMFYGNTTIDSIPFDFNFSTDSANCYQMFQYCKMKSIDGRFNNFSPKVIGMMFYSCENLRYLPEFSGFDFNYLNNTEPKNDNDGDCFGWCVSLRQIPEELLKQIYTLGTVYFSDYMYDGEFYYCASLDEIKGLSPLSNNINSNVFVSTFKYCFRLKNIIFDVQENGTPYDANWRSQSIKIDVGYCYGGSPNKALILDYNSGITADKEVTDDATYQALKNDPDWFTCDVNYSRYNHDSAVRTINSLPDTSAYLATAGGTNTIKFKGESGSLTDGGAVNTLTSSEIAVATAKGWTVSFD